MERKVLYGLVAVVACASAASISGMASFDPTQVSAGGQIVFPRIPGINTPISIPGISFPNSGNSSTNSSSNTPFGPFAPFLNMIPGLNRLIPKGNDRFPGIPNIDDLISNIPGLGNGTRNGTETSSGNSSLVVPSFPQFPGFNQGPYIPGLSEALGEARKHLQAALNISSDISTGMHDAIQTALDSDHPADSIRIIMDTIAKVYSTVAANCPLIIVGSRVFSEGLRLAGEVARSIANVAIGPENVP